VLDVLRRVAALVTEEPPVDPEVAGFFLRERGEVLRRAEQVVERQKIGAAEVVALTAAAPECERLAAVFGVDRVQASGDLGESRVPRDRLVRAVGAAAKRRRQTIGVVTVPLQTLRLLAEVPLRPLVRAIAAHARDLSPLRLHLEAAVHVAEDAKGLVPGRLGHGSCPPFVLSGRSRRCSVDLLQVGLDVGSECGMPP
jgi:hypothetical protein